MVSATCPLCHIMLVEANSNADNDLDAAEVIAAKDGYVQQVTPATAVAGQAVAVNYALRPYVPVMPWTTSS